MQHVVLLGDSVFANAAYIGGGPDVVTRLRHILPAGWRASLMAVDGGMMADIGRQLAGLTADVSHIMVSVGGNDALLHAAMLAAPSRSVADSLEQLAAVREQFRRDYRDMLDSVLRRALPTAVCTIYDPRYPDPAQRRVAAAALCLINDGIVREAALRGVPLVDLRAVCDDDADFATPIEPSVQGSGKIAAAIAALVTQHDFAGARSAIFTG